MWRLNPADLLQLKGAGGERFVHFVDQLIRAEAAFGGLPQSEIATQLRVNIKDGGVDTEVRQPIPRDRSSWFNAPTCWQFKAVDADAINAKRNRKTRNDLQKVIRKSYAEQLLRQGFGYRLCLLGDLTPATLRSWEDQLEAEARAINPNAPGPRVIHGGHLIAWAERFPAVVAWLRGFSRAVLHWEAWRDSCRKITRVYVPNPEWEGFRKRILEHADFNAPCAGEPCLSVEGAAGVGKTRLVFETLDALRESPGLVIYARDEQEAKVAAISLANTSDCIAVLVADECSLATRLVLDEILRRHIGRIRMICLDNMGEKLESVQSQIWLSPDSLKNTADILEANFPDVPEDRRRQYAELSGGFVRLAAAMCNDDAKLAAGDISALPGSIVPYVRDRLRGHLPVVSLLSLFHKVGFKDEVKADLEVLCKIANRSGQDFKDAVCVVRESPGFVVQAGRCWYVTPEIVARILFAEGWRRWVSPNHGAFLNKLPDHLSLQLIDRAGKLGGKEVRDELASFFRQWFGHLKAHDLSRPRTMSQACAIVESSPEEYLPKLRALIEDATPEDLSEIHGEAIRAARGPRRTLVWLLERLVSFPEFFRDCEACLFRLALHETEPQIANGATAIWKNLFGVVLPGTAVPFPQRIEILRGRTASHNLDEATLAFSGLASAFKLAPGHVIGPPVVAGRLRPPDWEPGSAEERLECYRAVLRTCSEYIGKGDDAHRTLAFDLLVGHLEYLLVRRFLEDVAKILAPGKISAEESRKVLNAVDRFLAFEELAGRAKASEKATRYIEAVERWSNTFRPSDFDGRLRSVCARDPWDRRFSDAQGPEGDETDELAQEILTSPARLRAHLDWLASGEARSAQRLGFAIGKLDGDFACGRMIFDHAIRRGSAPLLRGYVRGLVASQRLPSGELLELMSRLEAVHPEMAVDILCFGGDGFDALNRAIRLVEAKAVAPRFLANFAMGTGGRELSAEELCRLLPYFSQAAASDDADSARAGIRFIATYLMFEKRRSEQSCLESRAVRSQVWRLIEVALPFVESQLAYEWSNAVEELGAYDISRAAELLGQALLSESYDLGEQAQENLGKLAPDHPDAVMAGLGKALLGGDRSWRLQVVVLQDLVEKLPPRTVVEWVRSHGVEAARAIARHLPRPFLNNEGEPVVPELLDTILREFDDDQVFDNFLAGAHSGEMWYGDGSEQFRRDAEQARQFLHHPNHRIRKWARHEIDSRLGMAEWEQRRHAERFLPS
jgi:hypothetical protein